MAATVADAEAAFQTLREKDEQEMREARREDGDRSPDRMTEHQDQDIAVQSPQCDDVAEVPDNVEEGDKVAPLHVEREDRRDDQGAEADNDAVGGNAEDEATGARRSSDAGDVTDMVEEGEDTVIY